MRFVVRNVSLGAVAALFLLGVYGFSEKENIPDHLDQVLPVIFSFLGLVLVLAAFTERGDARRAWLLVTAGQGFVTLAIALNNTVPLHQLVIYLGAVAGAAMLGLACLHKIRSIDLDIALNRFHGYAYEKPLVSFAFLLCCLATIGFPFTPTFIGIDLLFTHIHKDQVLLITLVSLAFIFIELAILRVYVRIFLGQHKKNDHPIAFRSS